MSIKIIKKTHIAAKYQVISKILQQIVVFGFSIALARLLSPEEFGIIAIANLIIYYANSFTNWGFTNAIVQRNEIEKRHINSIFTLNFGISTFLFISVFLCSDLISDFFKVAELRSVVRWMATYFFITALYDVPLALLRRQIDFKFISIIDLSQSMLNYLCAVILAIWGFSYWSIIWPSLGTMFVTALYFIYKAKWIPKIYYSHKSMSEIYSFGLWNFLGFQCSLLVSKIDYFFIGKYLPVRQLGVYEKSFELTDRMLTSFSMPVSSVFFSSFSRLKNDKKTQSELFLDAIKIMSVLVFPALFGLIAITPYFVNVLLGEKWVEAILPMRLLAIAAVFKITNSITASLNVANGNYKKQTLLEIVCAIIFITSCILFVSEGIVAIAYCVIFYSILRSTFSLALVKKSIDLSYFSIIKNIGLPTLSSTVMMVAVYFCTIYYFTQFTVANLLALVLVGAVIYATIMGYFYYNGALQLRTSAD